MFLERACHVPATLAVQWTNSFYILPLCGRARVFFTSLLVFFHSWQNRNTVSHQISRRKFSTFCGKKIYITLYVEVFILTFRSAIKIMDILMTRHLDGSRLDFYSGFIVRQFIFDLLKLKLYV